MGSYDIGTSGLTMLVGAERVQPRSHAVEPVDEKGTFDVVVGEGQRLLVRHSRLVPPVQLPQEVAAGGAVVRVRGQLRIGRQWRQRVQAGLRAVPEPDRDRAV